MKPRPADLRRAISLLFLLEGIRECHGFRGIPCSTTTAASPRRRDAGAAPPSASSRPRHLAASPRAAPAPTTTVLRESAVGGGTAKASVLLSLTLTKPLGLVLEEVEEGRPRGAYVASVSEAGSAHPHRDAVLGSTVVRVQGRDATRLRFEQVMDAVASAPSPLDIEFGPPPPHGESGAAAASPPPSPSFPVGTPVTIAVLGSGKGSGAPAVAEIRAKVGDNLRRALLDSGVQVYEGFQNLGNCGGAGQCGYCAVDLVESEGWLERSEYEGKKLRRFPDARLSCLNSIQGPATIRKTKQ